jgi:hypothetical protein
MTNKKTQQTCNHLYPDKLSKLTDFVAPNNAPVSKTSMAERRCQRENTQTQPNHNAEDTPPQTC